MIIFPLEALVTHEIVSTIVLVIKREKRKKKKITVNILSLRGE